MHSASVTEAQSASSKPASVTCEADADAKQAETQAAVDSVVPDCVLSQRIELLRKQQQELQSQKKDLAKNLRNVERRRQRLRKRARQLTDEDLLAVLSLRKESRLAKADAKGTSGAEVVQDDSTWKRPPLRRKAFQAL